MKRKIIAIMATDIVGYSKLVSDDEEETIRRMSSYRSVFEDFVARYCGRIFNTAGDAFLVEFPSAVDAVRCAIDVQESLRTRNLAYPPSRQMCFRIGITVGDVIEREGDLLGDGVNIAARLEGLAQPGGICVSSIVYGQVANKLSVPFADMGEQQLKNIAEPVRAYSLALVRDQVPVPGSSRKDGASLIRPWPAILISGSIAVCALLGFIYVFASRLGGPAVAPPDRLSTTTAEVKPATEPLAPSTVPFITDRDRNAIRTDYLPAPGHKALAISTSVSGFLTGQKSIEAARRGALENCQRAQNFINRENKCELYAEDNAMIFARGRPPMPPEPWVSREPAIERPFDAKDVPLIPDTEWAQRNYVPRAKPKALAIARTGYSMAGIGENTDEVARRALEICGGMAGSPCMILAIDDVFVVPLPATLKPVGIFRAESNLEITADERDNVARRLRNARNGWNAVAVGASGRTGLALSGKTEQDAIDSALVDCAKRDERCRIIGLGPFEVAAKVADARSAAERVPPARHPVGAIKATVEKFNLIGRFAWDCSKPVARNNLYFVHRMLEGDRLQREQMSSATNRDWVVIYDWFEERSPNELAGRGMFTGRVGGRDTDNKPAFGTWRMEPNRFRQWDATVDGQKTIVNGHFATGGAEVPWINKCEN